MKKIFISLLFLAVFYSLWGIKPYYKLAEINKPINVITTEVLKYLLNNDLNVLGVYHPISNNNLTVIVFTCDELTSLATSVADKGAFGATLKVGLIAQGNKTIITMVNPCYFSYAYFNNDTNLDEVEMMTQRIDSLVNEAMSPLSTEKIFYGKDISKNELKNYHFLPYMARYEDVFELAEYDEYLDAVVSVRSNIMQGIEHSELIYELTFDDKEIAIFGVAFNGDNKLENELIDLWGDHCVAALPLEILIQGNKVYILNGKYRIPLYNPAINRLKLFKIVSLSSEIKDCMKHVANL